MSDATARVGDKTASEHTLAQRALDTHIEAVMDSWNRIGPKHLATVARADYDEMIRQRDGWRELYQAAIEALAAERARKP